MRSDWRFARRPVWLVGHLVALLAVAVFISAAFWQFDRHEARRALDAEIESRLAEPVVALSSIIEDDPAAIRFRIATAIGTFDTSEEVMLVLQSRDGVSGHRVLTPLVTAADTYNAVLVDRGWVPLELDQPGDSRFAPPKGEVSVLGYIRTTQTEGRRVPAEGELSQIGRVDLDRIQQQVDYPLAPVFLHLAEPIAEDGELPLLAPLPAIDSGPPHLSYAVQWSIFAIVVVVGYAILMVRTSRREDTESASG